MSDRMIFGRSVEVGVEPWGYPEFQANLIEMGYSLAERTAREDGYEPTGWRNHIVNFAKYVPDPDDPALADRVQCTAEEASTVLVLLEIEAVKL